MTSTSAQTGDGQTTSNQVDDADRLNNVNGVSYTWDDNGSLLGDGVNTYTYDHANRLIAFSDQQSLRDTSLSAFSFAYNGLGDRYQQTADGLTTTYDLDIASGLTQVLSDGSNTYLYGVNRIAQEHDGVMEYYLGDALGSVRQLATGGGKVVLAKSYEPYWELLNSNGEGTSSYGFTGEITDLSGLIYLRARYYSPVQGRFLTRNTWQGNVSQPISFNAWLYANANPGYNIDPSGYCPLPLNESDECRHLLLQIETEYTFIDLQSDLSRDNYWTHDELLNIQDDLERLNLAANIDLTILYPDDVKIKRVRSDTYFGRVICGGTPAFFTKGRSILLFNNWGQGCLIHELAHYLDDANMHLAKPFERYVGAYTFLWWYNPGSESPPIYNNGSPPNRSDDIAESLAEYVFLYTNYSGEDIGIIPGQKRWYFIESILDMGKIPTVGKSAECTPDLGDLASLMSHMGGQP